MSELAIVLRDLGRWAVVAVLVGGCTVRDRDQEPAVFDRDIAPILAEHCDSCHAGAEPPAGYRTGSFLDAVACVGEAGDEPAAAVRGGAAPILRALDREDHAGLLNARERGLVETWVDSGAPARRGAMHKPGMVDPRSTDFHGRILRLQRWAPMFDPENPGACGRCHPGAPVRPEAIRGTAAGATPCTSCHDTNEDGSFACTTCHGNGDQPAPPRDPCFFPVEPDAHLAHVTAGRWSNRILACTTCHPARDSNVRTGTHGDGHVDVVFDPELAGATATFDPTTGRCTNDCHSRGGDRRLFAWRSTDDAQCGDCHAIPPEGHYPGTCDRCHAEVSAEGELVESPVLHLDGIVEYGNGAGDCTACHGTEGEAWPDTGAHPSHRHPTLTAPLACESCHRVPADIHDEGHLDGVVQIVFGGLATARDASPEIRREDSSCVSVACHGEGALGSVGAVPRWYDTSGLAGRCGACHTVPPPPPHTTTTTCGAVVCHGGEVVGTADGPRITVFGRTLHIDGDLDVRTSETP